MATNNYRLILSRNGEPKQTIFPKGTLKEAKIFLQHYVESAANEYQVEFVELYSKHAHIVYNDGTKFLYLIEKI